MWDKNNFILFFLIFLICAEIIFWDGGSAWFWETRIKTAKGPDRFQFFNSFLLNLNHSDCLQLPAPNPRLWLRWPRILLASLLPDVFIVFTPVIFYFVYLFLFFISHFCTLAVLLRSLYTQLEAYTKNPIAWSKNTLNPFLQIIRSDNAIVVYFISGKVLITLLTLLILIPFCLLDLVYA